jgi:NADPH-dependent glutamate synthase beta subunit-like oxidoreductase/NAD-dependent dihydropyrimidine dehydrogenase PreA subunit
MRDPKDRLYRVLVIGANPAGIAATNKLGEMGIPVTLVDPDPDLDQKLALEAWRLDSGVPFNYAMRPGLLRILRNSQIRCVIPGEISSLKHTPQGFCAHLKNFETFIDPDRCVLCGRCAEVCPVTTGDGSKPIHYHGRQSLPGRPVIDKRRQPLCQANCPLGVNVQGYVALVRVGRFREALDLIRRDNVLPGICGRVCTHPCEVACRRGELDEPLAIKDIKRFVADYERTCDYPCDMSGAATRSESIAIIGSGPAGLAAAADLARLGYPVTVFEKEQHPGGLLRYGIGPYRLPRDILDYEIDFIRKLGVTFVTATPVDLTADLGELTKQYRAVILTTGIWVDRKLGIPGEDREGVEGCIEFLGRLYREEIKELHENVAVIGDGNAAFDVARAMVRLGAKVTILSWFPAELLPANAEEISAAREEGINLVCSAQVTAFLGAGEKLAGLRCMPTKPGAPDQNGVPWPVMIAGEAPFDLSFERAIVAIGQVGDTTTPPMARLLSTSSAGYFQVDGHCRTNVPGVYAAGDVARGPSSVVRAMANGREAARAVHHGLSGERLHHASTNRPAARDFPELPKDAQIMPRTCMPEREPACRNDLCLEVALGFDETQASAEAARCLQCGVCSECLQCLETCGLQGTIKHDEGSGKGIEHAGVVIIADPDAAPPIRGEDVIRAYSKKTEKDDVHAMMLRGFAAAAEAMLMLGGSSQRLKGHGLSFSPPDPQLSSEIRIGVFACRCKDSLGWSAELDDYLASLIGQPHVVHAEALVSACVPEGSTGILRTIRERRLTRVVLASCVCCPLNFICGSCTDPRSRLKSALFNATGISRSMVETCNLRGEVLRFLQEDPGLASARFRGLIERSIGRARHLKSLPTPARHYNFTTAVVADSEAAIRSALSLGEAGMEVFLFGTIDKPLTESPAHPNIHPFPGSRVKRLRGTVGNFQVMIETSGRQREFQVGAVIIGESSRKHIPYLPMEELTPRPLKASMQKQGISGLPFFTPGSTSVPGLFLANPPGIHVSERIKGTAAAILAASVMPRSPRQNKGYTVVVDDLLCRGCGRCVEICPYHAVSFARNTVGGYHAAVDEALCKGCGNCIAVCPSGAADCRYRDRFYLEQMIDEVLLW